MTHTLRIGDKVRLRNFCPDSKDIFGTVIRLSWAFNPETYKSSPSVHIHFDNPPISWYNDHESWPEENVILLDRPWRKPTVRSYTDREWIERQIDLVGLWK
jgi:hypothetical protein